MARLFLILLFGAYLLPAQQEATPKEPVQQAQEEPPEEDITPGEAREYAFNPIQAEKELKVGNFYAKKGSWKAAAHRFREATKWNPGMPEAWLRLAQSLERSKDKKAAREAYAKYLELAPDAKEAAEIKKKLNS